MSGENVPTINNDEPEISVKIDDGELKKVNQSKNPSKQKGFFRL